MIGDTLKSLRELSGATQDKMATMLCVKRQTYSAYERNVSTPDANTIKILANFFDVSADVILGSEGKTAPKEQPLTDEQKKLASLVQGLSVEEMEKVNDYIDFVKSKRNQ